MEVRCIGSGPHISCRFSRHNGLWKHCDHNFMVDRKQHSVFTSTFSTIDSTGEPFFSGVILTIVLFQ